MGADIDSACGQMVVLNKDHSKQNDPHSRTETALVDIEDSLAATRISTSTHRTSVTNKPSHNAGRAIIVDNPIERGTSDSKDEDPAMDLAKWIPPLQVATTIAASCFLMSAALYLKQRRR